MVQQNINDVFFYLTGIPILPPKTPAKEPSQYKNSRKIFKMSNFNLIFKQNNLRGTFLGRVHGSRGEGRGR